MRNRFKPNVSNSRAARNSSVSTENSTDNVASSSFRANSQQQDSLPWDGKVGASTTSEATIKEGQDNATQLKTPATSSTPAPGPLRRSRIKPAVVAVARGRPNSATKCTKTKDNAKQGSKGAKETGVSGLESHVASCKDDQFSANEPQLKEACDSNEENLRCSSLKERNQPHVPTPTCPAIKNTDQRSLVEASETSKKHSQGAKDNKNSENVTTPGSDNVGPPSLLRRKRVLPNLGSSSRRRHLSLSKENVDKTADILEVRDEEVGAAESDSHMTEQRSVVSSGNRSKGLGTLSDGEKSADPAVPPTMASGNPSKDDDDDDDDDEEEEEEEEEDNDNKRKGVKRKRGTTRTRKLKEPSDPSQMTMEHLIYYNPKTNPMTSSLAGKKKMGRRNKNKKSNDKEGEPESGVVDNASVCGSPTGANQPGNGKETSVAEDADGADGAAVAPRVKLDAEGNIILDEESLLIPKTPDHTLETSEVVYEDADEVNYGTYLKRRKVGRWSLEETQTFYKALSQVGTDFGLMLPLFPSRQRRELKAKFKREEKLHRDLIEKALRVRNPIEVELFTPKGEGEEIDDDLLSTDNNSSTQQT